MRHTRSRRRARRNPGLGFLPVAAAAPALATNPVGWVVLGVGALLSIFGMFSGAHAQAVANEAQILNAAVPAFVQQLQQILAAANAGQITAAQASGYVDQMLAAYYQNVGSILSKAGPCGLPDNCVWPGGQNSWKLDPCNGPCSVGCNFIEPAACMTKKILAAGGGTATVQGLNPHAGFQGTPDLTLTYAPPLPAPVTAVVPAAVAQGVNSAAASIGVPPWMLWAVGGLAAAKFTGVI